MCSKPICCSKVAPNAKSCRAQSGKAYRDEDGRTSVRSCDYQNFSDGWVTKFLRYGAPLASAKFARGASLLDYLHEPLKKKTKRQRKINYGVFQKSCSPQDACPKWGALLWITPGKTTDDVRCTSNESSQHQKTMHWGARDKRERCTQGNSTNGSKHTTMYRQVTPPFAFEENNAKPWPRESEIKTVSFLTFHHG